MRSEALTLSQFQMKVGNALRMEPSLRNAWIVAEFSDLRLNGGHCYMELLEKDDSGGIRAKARANIWASVLPGIRRKFYDATGRDIGSGIKVMLCATATHHPVYGFSINITDIDPSYTLGDMERLRREILARLQKEGLMECNRRLTLTPVPQRIAVVSAEGAAGYGDFMNQLDSNPEGLKVYPFLFPAVMQGERTAESVGRALDLVESTVDMWDCVVIIRGGGATTDLNGFDNYALARRVATFPLPVIVGIGHERDRTVLDEIACVRCKTPTAVAAFLLDRLRDSYSYMASLVEKIVRYSSDALRGEGHRLANIESSLPALVHNRVMRSRLALNDLGARLVKDAGAATLRARNGLGVTALRIEGAVMNAFRREDERLRRLSDMLRLLSPENTLRRGYSITLRDGKAVRSAAELKPGDRLETRFAEGKAEVEVIGKSE